jgi:hypothetical protein
MPGQFIKGAMVSFMPTFIGSLPNVIVFQFNPETITHTWTPASTETQAGKDPLATKDTPGEQFSFPLSLDSNDTIANSDANPIAGGLAMTSGVYTRLAALEMLLYPTKVPDGGLVGQVSASISAAGASFSLSATSSSATETVPQSEVPLVLFVWGPQRIVPVRVTALTITEKLYDTFLNPTHADVQMTLRVLTDNELAGVKGELKTVATIANKYTQGLRQVHALANLGDAAESIVGMLPSPF